MMEKAHIYYAMTVDALIKILLVSQINKLGLNLMNKILLNAIFNPKIKL